MRRVALMAGVDRYEDGAFRNLRYSVADAASLAAAFGKHGFETHVATNPGTAELLKEVKLRTAGLGPGDVFLFFFAGHGFTGPGGEHLLICSDDELAFLRLNRAGVPVNLLEELTNGRGFHRAFLLDACRTDVFAGRTARGAGTRDLALVAMPDASQNPGTCCVVRSCDRFCPALEYEDLGHGVFTQAVLDLLDGPEGRTLRMGEEFVGGLRQRMAARLHDGDSQNPHLDSNGEAFALFEKAGAAPAAPPAEDRPSAEKEPRTKKKRMPPKNPAPPPPREFPAISVPPGKKAGEKRTFRLSPAVSMDFRWCPPGEFDMGSPVGEKGRKPDEYRHRVRLTKGFWIAETPVIQIQWENLMGRKANRSPWPKGAEKPATAVSYEDALDFIGKLRETGLPARLPTEAEWEYACRAGTDGPFGAKKGLFLSEGRIALAMILIPVYGLGLLILLFYWIAYCCQKIAPVRQFEPNAWGLHDMHGNCGEWCSDWYGAYPAAEVEDPSGPSTGRKRVVRGMRRMRFSGLCRSATRWFMEERTLFGMRRRHPLVGIRIVLGS